jgi:lipid-binding SYLF domain-containing protein
VRPREIELTKEGLAMRIWIVVMAIGIVVAVGLGFDEVALGKDPTKAEQQAAIRKEAQNTLAKLYQINPSAKAAIQKSAGYAAFDNFGMHLFMLSTARGKGIAVASTTKKETFMKVMSVGAGIGLGVKDFRVVFVFENPEVLNNFVNSGWDADAHGEAMAKAGQKGGAFEGAISVSPGVWVYQFTEKGLALQATLQGTKYYKNDDLN